MCKIVSLYTQQYDTILPKTQWKRRIIFDQKRLSYLLMLSGEEKSMKATPVKVQCSSSYKNAEVGM